ncbi:MAG: hypothetical protein JO057_04590 [Chloroflexi bacterium]|nr:hypothetical protein [Chloroflexota bacterium]
MELPDAEVELALGLLACAWHVRLPGVGHPLHGAPGGTRGVMAAIRPFLEALSVC